MVAKGLLVIAELFVVRMAVKYIYKFSSRTGKEIGNCIMSKSRKIPKNRNPEARALASPIFRQKIVPKRKGAGAIVKRQANKRGWIERSDPFNVFATKSSDLQLVPLA